MADTHLRFDQVFERVFPGLQFSHRSLCQLHIRTASVPISATLPGFSSTSTSRSNFAFSVVVPSLRPSCQSIAHSHCHQPVVADILPHQQESGALLHSQLCCILYRAILERWLTRGRTQGIHSPRSFLNPLQAPRHHPPVAG